MATSNNYASEESLWQVAYNTAYRAGFRFSPDCEQDLKQQISIAFVKIKSDRRNVQDLQNNIEKLVLTMIQVLRERAPESKTLGEFSLAGALKKLCPLYPFC